MRARLIVLASVFALPIHAAGDEEVRQVETTDATQNAKIMSGYRALPVDIQLPALAQPATAPTRSFRANPPFLDRAAAVNVWRERRSVEFVRLWTNRFARVYVGVSPTGFTGLCISPRIKPRKPKAVARVRDYSDLVEQLTSNDSN
ncbi:MAG: hypothetical protein AAGC71_06775 [Pseudomonadota bacterium]